MKRTIYIFCFMFLGLLGATVLHAIIEIPLLNLAIDTPETYQNVFWWQHWGQVHRIGGITLWLFGATLGIWLGFRYWQIIYGANQAPTK